MQLIIWFYVGKIRNIIASVSKNVFLIPLVKVMWERACTSGNILHYLLVRAGRITEEDRVCVNELDCFEMVSCGCKRVCLLTHNLITAGLESRALLITEPANITTWMGKERLKDWPYPELRSHWWLIAAGLWQLRRRLYSHTHIAWSTVSRIILHTKGNQWGGIWEDKESERRRHG